MILQIISIVVTLILVYLLWNKKYVTHVHIIFDHTGKVVDVVRTEKNLLNRDQEVKECDATNDDGSTAA